ncbi:MAG: 23S rRNA (uridine(2552)-2'-O)-methyltransferase RlmE [Gammaproteobacteria bacterium]|nr:23S rRNA (uridine(2552)-2'-O)-methyltransferase RlmE [Gammaproteobacteria bacterium]
MAKSKPRSRWMQRHLDDDYVKRAQRDGYRSRAAYKLLEIQEKDKLIKPGMMVIDIGAAPGGWTQVAANLIGDHGKLIALDILPMDPFPNVEFIQGDFREDEVYQQLIDAIADTKVDLVICDIAPNISGLKSVDIPRAMYLSELGLELARQVLKPGGDFLVKVFQGEGIEDMRREIQKSFSKLLTRKPKASRAESREVYLLGRERIV